MSEPIDCTTLVPYDAVAPALAREFVAALIADRSRELCDDAALLVSELVTNAVRYGRPDIRLRLVTRGLVVRLEVVDGGGDQPQLPAHAPSPARPSGRGLLIVDAVAARWGVDPAGAGTAGKRVWFELEDAIA